MLIKKYLLELWIRTNETITIKYNNAIKNGRMLKLWYNKIIIGGEKLC